MTVPSSSVAVALWRALRARIASPACALERTSSHLPNTMSETITAATSKYTCPVPRSSTTMDHVHAVTEPTVTRVSMVVARWRADMTVERWNGQPL